MRKTGCHSSSREAGTGSDMDDVNGRSAERGSTGGGPSESVTSSVGIRDLLRDLTVCQQDFERRLADHLGVDAAGLSVMNHLGSAGSATPTEIAHLLDASTAATTLVLNRLEKAGHLTRSPHPTDRRKVVVTPNPATLRAAYEMLNPIIDGVDGITARLAPGERAAVETFLDDMIALYRSEKPATVN